MSCCSPINDYNEKPVGECPDCGIGVDEDGNAIEGCSYSPEECNTCGWRPCDLSC
jgi:hypothetical protein